MLKILFRLSDRAILYRGDVDYRYNEDGSVDVMSNGSLIATIPSEPPGSFGETIINLDEWDKVSAYQSGAEATLLDDDVWHLRRVIAGAPAISGTDAEVATALNEPTGLVTGAPDGAAALTSLIGIAIHLGAVVADFKPIWNYPDWMSRCESGLEKGRLADVQALLAVIPITLSEASETAITQALGSMVVTRYNKWRAERGLEPAAAVTEQDVAAARA